MFSMSHKTFFRSTSTHRKHNVFFEFGIRKREKPERESSFVQPEREHIVIRKPEAKNVGNKNEACSNIFTCHTNHTNNNVLDSDTD